MNNFLKNLKLLSLVLLLCSISQFSWAQDEDEEEVDPLCEMKPSDKKTLKLYETGMDRKKGDGKSRYKALKDALAGNEECAPCAYQLGIINWRKLKAYGGEYFEHTSKYFKAVVDICPKYSADVYYFLGVVEYQQNNDKEASKWFKKFLNFSVEDEDRLGKDYGERVAEVKTVLPEIEKFNAFFADFYGNEVPFKPELVENVSSQKEEYLPMISPDNEVILYTRKYDYKPKGDAITQVLEELTLSERQTWTSPFTSGEKMPAPLNSPEFTNYGGVSLSIDNKEMYLCACKMEAGYRNCDLYSTHYELVYNEEKKKDVYMWSELKNLGPNVNGNQTWEAQPSISADGNTLYFATARADCYKDESGGGTMDIFYSEKQSNGDWGPAKNLGPQINSRGHDKAPFMHSDSRTLYFVSQVTPSRLGGGGFDIFYTRQNKETGKWAKPKNIGHPINTEDDEEGIVVSADGEIAYFSSSRKGGAGKTDIYTFLMPEKAKPDKILIMKGKITDDNGAAVDSVELEVTIEGDNQVVKAPIKTDKQGNSVAIVNVGKRDETPKDVLMTIKKEGHAFESKLIKKEELTQKGAKMVKDEKMKVTELKEGMSYTINDVLYKTASAELDPRSRIVLDGFARFLNENEAVNIEIQGHTDDLGNDATNMALSQDRAFTVMEYLNEKGIKTSRMKFKGYGETKPKVKNDSDINRAKNRRTDFKILSI